MKKTILVIASLSLISTANIAGEFSPSTHAKKGCPGKFFTQKAVVFDAVTLCATQAVAKDKFQHAANVTAQWLDNDQDGKVDEPRLIEKLQKSHATLLMSNQGFTDDAMDSIGPDLDDFVGQDLAANETAPKMERDASQEEIHHLILNAGWQKLYPEIFSSKPKNNSQLHRQWALAESKGYYDYGDPTCDADCKTTEFFYLATAAYLGSSADLESDEMRLKNRTELQEKLPEMIKIMHSSEYHYPTTIWPDGNYTHQNNIKF